MDWSKAKTILIVAFIIINLILGYSVLKKQEPKEILVNDKLIDTTINLLNNKGISIETSIPNDYPALLSLIVEYENIGVEYLNNKFFDGRGEINRRDKSYLTIKNNSEEIIYERNKKLTYTNSLDSTDIDTDILSNEEAVDLCYDFLRERGFKINDAKVSYVDKDDDVYLIIISKFYNNAYIENAYTKFIVDKNKITYMERIWLNVVREGEKPIKLDNAPKALLELLSVEDAYNKSVVDISLCYYFNAKENTNTKEPLDVKRGKAMPTWRIQLDDGTKIIIDTF